MDHPPFFCEGGCTCRHVRYGLHSAPIVVHCCHCRWCQRETGSAFAINAVIETERIELTSGAVELVHTPSLSGKGQRIARCPHCRIALWSHYAGGGETLRFVRVGTLDNPDLLPPDVHIFTATRQPWVLLPEGTPAVSAFYRGADVLSPDSLARRNAAYGRVIA